MTIVPTWTGDVAGPVMHALVIGVAGYPSAKEDQGVEASLRQVQDVPCTVASARRVADWLFDNKGRLSLPLGSIDLLLSEAEPDPKRAPYPMRLQPQVEIMAATKHNVTAHGRAWSERFKTGDSAFLFISGHGATKINDAVVFLSDLNSDPYHPWGEYFNVSYTARALKADQRLTAAFIFSDACQEYSDRFAQVQSGEGAQIVKPVDPLLLASARDKVLFVTAASQGLETLEGDWDEDAKVKMGRFTQVLIKALDGASARRVDGSWVVHADGIAADLKDLYRMRKWTDTFEPSRLMQPNEPFPIVVHSDPQVPFIVKTNPADRLSSCLLQIFLPYYDRSVAAIQRCDPAPRQLWEVWLRASDLTHLLVADHSGVERELPFTPNGPIFGKTVAFS